MNRNQSLVWEAINFRWKSGIEINNSIKSSTGKKLRIWALYPTLRHFEDEGSIESKWEDNEDGSRTRFYRKTGTHPSEVTRETKLVFC